LWLLKYFRKKISLIQIVAHILLNLLDMEIDWSARIVGRYLVRRALL